MKALARLEEHWGYQRHIAEAAALAASQAAQSALSPRRSPAMLNSAIPDRLYALPWRVLITLLALGGFGLAVLFSAAGGDLRPWALNQGIRFALFLRDDAADESGQHQYLAACRISLL